MGNPHRELVRLGDVCIGFGGAGFFKIALSDEDALRRVLPFIE